MVRAMHKEAVRRLSCLPKGRAGMAAHDGGNAGGASPSGEAGGDGELPVLIGEHELELLVAGARWGKGGARRVSYGRQRGTLWCGVGGWLCGRDNARVELAGAVRQDAEDLRNGEDKI